MSKGFVPLCKCANGSLLRNTCNLTIFHLKMNLAAMTSSHQFTAKVNFCVNICGKIAWFVQICSTLTNQRMCQQDIKIVMVTYCMSLPLYILITLLSMFTQYFDLTFVLDYLASLEPREILLYRDVKDQSIRCKLLVSHVTSWSHI